MGVDKWWTDPRIELLIKEAKLAGIAVDAQPDYGVPMCVLLEAEPNNARGWVCFRRMSGVYRPWEVWGRGRADVERVERKFEDLEDALTYIYEEIGKWG